MGASADAALPAPIGEIPAAPDAGSALDELRRGWRPLLACSVGIGLGVSPFPAYTASIFAIRLEREFGWSRGAILASISFITVALVLFGPALGRYVDRRGTRRVAIASTACLGVAILGLSLITDRIWTFYLGWAAMCIGGLGTLPLVYGRVINGWFRKARGLALGISFASTGVVGAFLPFYSEALIEAFGWRMAYVGLAALPLLVSLPILLLFLREPPEDAGALEDQATGGIGLGAAIRDYRFWSISIGSMGLGIGVGGLVPNLIPILTEAGYTMPAALQAMAALALSVMAGRLVTGFLLDRLWAPLVGAVLATPVLAGLWLIGSGAVIPGATIIVGITLGPIGGAEFDLVSYLTSRYFGQRHFSLIYSVQYAIFGAGAGLAPGLFGFLRDWAGSYQMVLVIAAGCFATTMAALLTLGRYPGELAPQRG